MTEQEKFESWIEQVKTQNPEILDLENNEPRSQNLIGWCWAAWQAALASATKGNPK